MLVVQSLQDKPNFLRPQPVPPLVHEWPKSGQPSRKSSTFIKGKVLGSMGIEMGYRYDRKITVK